MMRQELQRQVRQQLVLQMGFQLRELALERLIHLLRQ